VQWQCDVCPGLAGGCPGVEVHVARVDDDPPPEPVIVSLDDELLPEPDEIRLDDDMLPIPEPEPRPNRIKVAANIALVAGGLALAGGAAYGVVPGELGDHGAKLVSVSSPPEESPVQTLADAYAPSHQLLGGASASLGSTTDPHIVYVDGATPSDGPAIISTAFPSATNSVLATRGDDGSCTYLRGDGHAVYVATVHDDSPCEADQPPARGWHRYIAP
jgi:hypothetical protein